MSGKMKKLICALLTGTMVLSSIGFVGFAADDDAAAAATEVAVEATEAPAEAEAEATEAPAEEPASESAETAVTPVPAAETVTATESSSYDNDAYYQKALSLCKALGIITGYEDGSVKPESNVTRAEMSAIILRMLANGTTSTYQGIFTDVAAEHWAANTIQTAASMGIVNGMGDGTFNPDGNVQYEQVAKMIVCAMNYTTSAEYYGGYPNGYLKVASDLEIVKNASGKVGTASERGVVIKMVYNALLADYNEPTGTESGHQQYKSDRTLAEYAFDVKEEKGTLLGTATTSLTNKDLTGNQILIQSTTEDDEDPIVYTTSLKGMDSLLASNITLYYLESDSGDTRELLAVTENTSKTESVTLSNDDINEIDSFEGFDGTKGEIKLYGSKKYKLADNIRVVYNGSIIDETDFDNYQSKASKTDSRFYKNITKDEDNNIVSEAKTYQEFLQPSQGTIRLVENDSDKDGYDYIFIDAYETLLVSSATSKKVVGNIFGQSVTIDVDEEANSDLTITTTIGGEEAKARNLKKDNVVSVKRSLDDETIEFTVTGENLTGTVRSISTDDDKTYATIDGKKYEVDANTIDDVKTGSQSVFYFDIFGRIGYAETTTAEGLLQSGEKYAWIMNIFESDDKEDIVVNLMTQDGKATTYTLGSSLDYWAPTASEPVKISGTDEVKETIQTLYNSNGFIKMDSTPIRLIKYKTNSSNELTRIYCAVNASDVTNDDALRINPSNQHKNPSVNGSVAGYTIPDGILEISAPKSTSDMRLASNYSVGEAASTNYVVRENGSDRDYVIGEFKNSNANIIINFTASANEPAPYTDMGTADDGPAIMIVDSISSGWDDDDNPIYNISGYIKGSEVSVTTNKNTNVGTLKLATDGSIFVRENNNTYFGFNSVWTALNSEDGLEDYIHKGDIIMYTTNGKVILRYASAATAKFDEDGNFVESSIPAIGSKGYYGSSRVVYRFGKVLDTGLDDNAYVTLSGVDDNIVFDPSTSIDLVTINKNGGIKLEKSSVSISDIETGDYMLVNLTNKMTSIKAIIVYRFE